MFGWCRGHVRVVSRSCLGGSRSCFAGVSLMLGWCLGHVWVVSRSCIPMSWSCFGGGILLMLGRLAHVSWVSRSCFAVSRSWLVCCLGASILVGIVFCKSVCEPWDCTSSLIESSVRYSICEKTMHHRATRTQSIRQILVHALYWGWQLGSTFS